MTSARSVRRTTATVTVGEHRVRRGRWVIDAGASTLSIGVKFGMLATVTGRFTELTGHIDVNDGIVDSSIAVSVATASLTSGSRHWDSVLGSAGLVDTTTNPTIQFESTTLEQEASGWRMSGVLVTERGCLPVTFALQCLPDAPAGRIRFRATGAVASKDAVRLLSRPGVDRLIGRQMSVDLLIEAVHR